MRRFPQLQGMDDVTRVDNNLQAKLSFPSSRRPKKNDFLLDRFLGRFERTSQLPTRACTSDLLTDTKARLGSRRLRNQNYVDRPLQALDVAKTNRAYNCKHGKQT